MQINIIKHLTFCINVLVLIIIDIVLWTVSIACGIGGLIGIISFFIGYSISGGMAIAPRDYWKFPEYQVFKKKLGYANAIAGGTTLVATYVLMVLSGFIAGM